MYAISLLVFAAGATPADVAWAWSTPPATEAAVALAWASAEVTACKCGQDCSCGHGGTCCCTPKQCYEQLMAKAAKESKPLIVGVGIEPPHYAGALACRWDELPGGKSGVLLGKGDGKTVWQVRQFPTMPTEQQIRAALTPSAHLAVGNCSN